MSSSICARTAVGFGGATAMPGACGWRPGPRVRDGGGGAANPPGTKPLDKGADTKPSEG
jgi:hypothetical protein